LLFVFFLFGIFNKGVVLFPKVQPNLLNVSIETAPGTSLDVTDGFARTVEQRLTGIPGYPDMEFVVTSTGSSDNPFDFGGQGTSNKGTIAVNFYEKKERRQSSFVTLEEVRDTVQGIPGAILKVTEQKMGPPVGAPVSIEIAGEDYMELAALSARIQEEIRAIPGLVDVKDNYNAGRPEIIVEVDREKAAMLYMSTQKIANTVRAAISGIEASEYRVGEDEYKIRVRLREEQRTSPQDLENLRITFLNKKGKLFSVPLVSVAAIRKTTALADIQRKDQKRVITITGNVQGRLGTEVLQDVKTRLAGLELPSGCRISYTGEDEEQKKTTDFLTRAFMITLLLVFLILVSEFNSVRVPFVIMISVPLSLIGVLIGLMVTFTPFSIVMTGVGVVSLAGIVVKNAIVFLDFMKHLRARGLSVDEALLEAGRTRLRPVVLTAASTVLAILPLATGFDFDWRAFRFIVGAESADFWRPMGVAIIFGLSISTFLTLIIIPTIYSLLDTWNVRFKELIGRMRNSTPATQAD
ncbi:MAG: efflux RND transporter permease subunit, partial [Bacteroidetes bacterium]|nr:efflux RND transporter permease subunit [Bacteroidota bacterium]